MKEGGDLLPGAELPPCSVAAHSDEGDPQAVEPTPTPMVIGPCTETEHLPRVMGRVLRGCRDEDTIPTPPEPHSQRRRLPSRSSISDTAPSLGRALPASYHPPKTPPRLVERPRGPRVSVSVVPECDPRAPTRPRMRRKSSIPPPQPQARPIPHPWLWALLGLLGVVAVFTFRWVINAPEPANQASFEGRVRGTTNDGRIPASGEAPLLSVPVSVRSGNPEARPEQPDTASVDAGLGAPSSPRASAADATVSTKLEPPVSLHPPVSPVGSGAEGEQRRALAPMRQSVRLGASGLERSASTPRGSSEPSASREHNAPGLERPASSSREASTPSASSAEREPWID